MAKKDITFGIEGTINKSNLIKSSSFHMDEGDILHIIYRDHSGATVTIALVDAEGEVEVIQVIPTTTPAPTTTLATTTLATTTIVTTTPVPTTTIYTTTTTVEPDEFILYGALYNWYAVSGMGLGALYNWYAVDTGMLAGAGWRIPTETDAITLQTYLGGEAVAGGKLKEIGIIYWTTPNTGATNEVGFNARGAGLRVDGNFDDLLDWFEFWTDHDDLGDPDYSTAPAISYNDASFYVWSQSEKKINGCSVRPVRDATVAEQLLADGTACADYVGNDGKIYPTVKIGTQVWLAANLAETLYNDLSAIPEVTDDATWAALGTGAMCYYDNDIRYSLPPITGEGWDIPDYDEFLILYNYLTMDARPLKENNLAYWDSPLSATNTMNFNARGSGRRRGADGIFDNIKTFIEIWLDDNLDPEYGTMFIRYNIDTLSESSESFNTGCAVRFVRAATVDEQLLADGTACADYVGNDGRSYGTVKIGTQVWLSENLAETLYNDLSAIPEVTDAGAWAALTTGAMCYYDNNPNYAYYTTTTLAPTTTQVPLIDIDGNEYTSVIIGDQEWIVENFRATHYRNGDVIPNLRNSTTAGNFLISWMNVNYDTFVSSGGSITSAIEASGTRGLAHSNSFSLLAEDIINYSIALTVIIGTAPSLLIYRNGVLIESIILTNGLNEGSYPCANSGDYHVGLYSPLTGCSFSAVCAVGSYFNMGWSSDTDGACCYYDNNAANVTDYGMLYNWYAVDNANELVYLERSGVEETDWRVPTYAEIQELVTALGGSSLAGGALKMTGTTYWDDPNVGASNSSGWTGYGGGYRSYDGSFTDILLSGAWWTSTEFASGSAYYLLLESSEEDAFPDTAVPVNLGASVRLVRDLTPATTATPTTTLATTTLASTTTTTPVYLSISTSRVGTLTLSLGGLGDISVIDWGDGEITNYTLTGGVVSFNHTYVSAGTKTIVISGAENIDYISAEGGGVTAITIPAEMVAIEEIYLSGNTISTFTTHAEWVNLRVLDLGTNNLNSVTTRSAWVDLEILDVSNNNLSALTTYSSWVALTTLIVDYNSLTSLTTYGTWVNLSVLSAYSNSLTNILARSTWGGTSIEFNVANNAIADSTAINNILVALNATTKTSGTVDLSGGTNAAPTGSGITAMGALVAKGIEVTVTEIDTADYYVATPANGGNDYNPGTFEAPFATWQRGFAALDPGETCFIRGGTYYPTGTYISYFWDLYAGVAIRDNSGTAALPITVRNYPGETPVLDCRNITNDTERGGIVLYNCDYWYLYGLTVTRVDQNSTPHGGFGFDIVYCNNIILDGCVAHDNAGSGIRIGYDSEDNLINNCDAYNNYDSYTGGFNSDGIEVSFITDRTPKRTNTIIGCRSWNNSDDGYDFYSNEGYLIVENCWAWHNGFNKDGDTVTGDGNGFKLGSQFGTPVSGQVTVTNCLAFSNASGGFTMESDTGGTATLHVLYNNTAYHNCLGDQSWNWQAGFQGWSAFNVGQILRNNLSYDNADGNTSQFGSNYIQDHNSWNYGVTVSSVDFVSLDDTGMDGDRQSDGSLPYLNFLRLTAGSDLINAGVAVGLPYSGTAPDIGAFEFTTTLVITGQTYTDSTTGTWWGVEIPRTSPTDFTFSYNSITSVNTYGYMLQAGDEDVAATNNNLNGQTLIGNYFDWNGTFVDRTTITHGVFVGNNINVIAIYNYLDTVPMGFAPKASSSMTYTEGGFVYNIVKNPNVGVSIKGMSGICVYNNTFYQARTFAQTYRALIDIYTNTDGDDDVVASGVKIKNNIFYTVYQTYNIWIYDAACLTGFECDYNLYYCEAGTPIFNYLGSSYTFAQWQALGYDTHSVVVNPGFTSTTTFVPAARLDYGTDLGSDYDTGLFTSATWVVGTSPSTAQQNGSWQVGARVFGEATTTSAPATTLADMDVSYLSDETYLYDETNLID